MIGRKMHLIQTLAKLIHRKVMWQSPYQSRRKAMPTMIAKSLTVQCSAFLNTFHRQYMKAAIQRNHSRHAASITTPTMAV